MPLMEKLVILPCVLSIYDSVAHNEISIVSAAFEVAGIRKQNRNPCCLLSVLV